MEINERVRDLEISQATIKTNLEYIRDKIDIHGQSMVSVKDEISELKKSTTTWNAAVATLSKGVFLISAILSMSFALIKYMSG